MDGHPLHPLTSANLSTGDEPWEMLLEFDLPSMPGSERRAVEQVALIARSAGLRPATLERLKTAVAEATLNAIEHGNHYQAELRVRLAVQRSPDALRVDVSDQGEGEILPTGAGPDLQAKLAGLQSPRGWGMFLIQNMVDEMHVSSGRWGHTIQLIVYLTPADAQDGSAKSANLFTQGPQPKPN